MTKKSHSFTRAPTNTNASEKHERSRERQRENKILNENKKRRKNSHYFCITERATGDGMGDGGQREGESLKKH